MIDSGGQQRDLAIHIHVSIVPQTPLPSRLPDNIEQSSMCYIVGFYWLSSFNYSSVYMYIPNSLILFSIRVQLMNNVLVPGIQKGDLVIQIPVPNLPQIPFPHRSL